MGLGELWLGDANAARADRKLCHNPFWAGHHDFQRFPSQKSAAIRLGQGKAYPLTVLFGNGHEGGSASVAWTRPGAANPEIIGEENLVLTPAGKQPGARQRIWGGVTKVAENAAMTLSPDSVRATQCYLGRGLQSGHFGGMMDRFTVHSVALGNPIATNP